jgi:hypothetical protein
MRTLPKFVKVIVDDAHDTTKGRIYQVSQDQECAHLDGLWILSDDVGDEYYLYESEYGAVDESK